MPAGADALARPADDPPELLDVDMDQLTCPASARSKTPSRPADEQLGDVRQVRQARRP
jgi:hypothetical protein